ncbi:MAG: hypothetical protein RIS70_1695 [Planctomycetota bacterium]
MSDAAVVDSNSESFTDFDLPQQNLRIRIVSKVKRCLIASAFLGCLGGIIGLNIPPADGWTAIGCLAQMVAGTLVFGSFGIFVGAVGVRLLPIALGTVALGSIYALRVLLFQTGWTPLHFANALTIGLVGGSLFGGLISIGKLYLQVARRITVWLQV